MGKPDRIYQREEEMKQGWKYVFIGLLIQLSAQQSAFAGNALTLDEVIASVDKYYPLVIGALQDQEKAQGDLRAARGGFDPLLKSVYQVTPSGEYENRYYDTVLEQPTTLWGSRFFAGYRNGQGQFGPYDERLKTNRGGEVRAGVELPLLRGGVIDERRARLKTSEVSLDGARFSVDVQKLDARRLATHVYLDWLAAGEKLKVAKSLLQLAQDRDDAMKHRVTHGDAAQIDRIDNQRSVVQRESTVVSSKRALEKATLDLSIFYRDSHGQPMLVSQDRLPEGGISPPKNENITLHSKDIDKLTEHPELKRLEAQVEINQIDRRLAANSIFPKLDTEFTASKDLGDGLEKKGRTEYKAALKLEFPLFLRSGRGRLEAVSAQSIKLDAQMDLARDRILVSVNNAHQAMKASYQRYELITHEVDLSIKVEEAERVRFRHGDSNILTVNLREQATADARVRVIDALVDYHKAKADFDANSAGLLR